MTLIKTTFFTSLTTFAKLVAGFFINKALAVFVGPSGMAAVGQFKNFSMLVTTFSSGATNTGVTKYISQYKSTDNKQKLVQTALSFGFLVSLFIAASLSLLRNFLSERLLQSTEYSYLFSIFALTIVLFSLNSLMLSILNGFKQIKHLTLANISNSIISLVLTVLLIYWYGLSGALVALVINQSVVFLATVIIIRKLNWFRKMKYQLYLNRSMLIKLIKFSVITITSVITGPLSLILVRSHIAETMSWEFAGYWEGLWQLSTMYLSFITASLSVYYLPKLSEISNKSALLAEMKDIAKVVLPALLVAIFLIYLLRTPITLIVFSEDFLPITELFTFQLIGDFFKVTSWLISYVFIAKAMILETVITSILANFLFVILVFILLGIFGLYGATIAYALNYFVYLIVVTAMLKFRYFAR